jgi:hypothetical protein
MINAQNLAPPKLVPLIELMSTYKRSARIEVPPFHSLMMFSCLAFATEQASQTSNLPLTS